MAGAGPIEGAEAARLFRRRRQGPEDGVVGLCVGFWVDKACIHGGCGGAHAVAPEGDGGDVGAGGEVLDDGVDVELLVDAEGNVLAVGAAGAGEVEGEDGHAVGEGAIEEDGRFCAARAIAVQVDYCGQDGKGKWGQGRRGIR